MHSPDNEYPVYSAGSAAICLLSLTMKKEEIPQKSASIRDTTTGMIMAIVQQQRPPMKSARDTEMSSSDSELPVTTCGPRIPLDTLIPKSSSRGKDPVCGMYSYRCSQEGHLSFIEPSRDCGTCSVRRCSQNGHSGYSDIAISASFRGLEPKESNSKHNHKDKRQDRKKAAETKDDETGCTTTTTLSSRVSFSLPRGFALIDLIMWSKSFMSHRTPLTAPFLLWKCECSKAGHEFEETATVATSEFDLVIVIHCAARVYAGPTVWTFWFFRHIFSSIALTSSQLMD